MAISFPNESAAYRAARDELLQAEIALRERVAEVAASRQALPPGGELKEDYVFRELDQSGGIREVRLSELFGQHDTLFLYSFMYGPAAQQPCSMCSSLLDALDGNAPHLAQRLALAVVAQSPIERIADYAGTRGWGNLRLLSAHDNSYQVDYSGATADGAQMPMANVFERRDGSPRHFWGSELLYADVGGDARHMDAMWPLWNVLDATPAGRGADWYPSLLA